MTDDRSAPLPEDSSPGEERLGMFVSSSWRAVMALARVVVPSGFVLTAVIGAVVTTPVTMLVVAPMVGGVAGVMVALLNPAFPAEPWARRGVVLTAATGAAFVPFTVGVALFGAAGGALALVLLVLGSCLAADKIADVIENLPAGGALRDDHWLRTVMPSLPTGELLREWRATGTAIGPRQNVVQQTRAAHIRGVLLEELARRDPDAVEQWLTSGDWSSEPQMRPDSDVAG